MIRPFFCLLFSVSLIWLSACTPRLAGGYEVKNGKVIYHTGMTGLGSTSNKVVEGADATTFEKLDRYYGRDKHRAYYRGDAIKNTHGPTFELLTKPYQKDKNHVFYAGKVISDYPKDFRILFSVKHNSGGGDTKFATDGRHVFKSGSKFLPDEVDPASFERIGNTRYFKDKNHVYDIASVVESADPASFEVNARFNGTFSKDKNGVFFEGRRVEDIDLDSHRILDRYHHKDKSAVYFRREVLSKDPENFTILSESYSRDSKHAYWRAKRISDDAENFVAYPSRRGASYGKDSKNAFWGWKTIPDADVASFVGLNHNYAKDKDNVYFAVNTVNPPKVIKDADPATFALVKGEKGIDARDKDGPFNFGHRRRKKNK